MFNEIKKSLVNLRKVFSKVKFVIVFLLFGFLFYLLNFFISAFFNISSFYKTRGFSGIIYFTYELFINFRHGMLPSSFISIVILSFLSGILFSLMFYKINLRKGLSSKENFLSFTGMSLGIFAPGCAACGLGLVAFFGLATSFATLPLKGLEISILAMIILSFSIIKFSYNLFDDNCKINFNKNERGLNKNE